ncbi:transmembrane protein 223-like [Panonychus citri]|uniref:transmembrane protein 223-like n=1 Tax=Panonychus citri TaxID=50023 RepID=UPI0023080CEB|nr:transmembrane protein 223-like [Panonychus citri]
MSSSKLFNQLVAGGVQQEKNKIIYALKDFGVYFRRTFLAGFGSLICVYGGGFIYTLDSLPAASKQIEPIQFLLNYRYPFSISLVLFGMVAYSTNKFFLWRTISMIELREGGKEVAFKALSRVPLSRTEYSFRVPLSHVSCVQSRRDTKSPYVLFKIKGKLGNYYIDKDGYFPDPSLFDYSIGVARKF